MPSPAPGPAYDYAAAWERLRRRRRLRPYAVVLVIAGAVLFFAIRSDARFIGSALVALAMIFMGFWTSFRCPRCGKLFGRSGYRKNHFTEKCLNCGIRIGTPGPTR